MRRFPSRVAALISAGLILVVTFGSPGAAGGFFIAMPAEAGSPGRDPSGGALVSMKTNLPDGTLTYIKSEAYGGGSRSDCCPTVANGSLDFHLSGECLAPVGAESRGFNISVFVAPDASRVTGPFGLRHPGKPQPRSVQEVLGPNFERLEGRQVATFGGVRILVASAVYAWPKDSCDGPMKTGDFSPDVCRPDTTSINDDEGGANLTAVAATPVGTLSYRRLCDLYNYATDEFQRKEPWPRFRDRASAWIDANKPLGGANYEFFLSSKIVRQSTETLGHEFDSPAWIEADYFLRGKRVGHARFVARIWYAGYTKWDMAELELF